MTTVIYNAGRYDKPRLATVTGAITVTATHVVVGGRRIHRTRVRRVTP